MKNNTPPVIKYDVMIGDRYQRTVKVSLGLPVDYIGDEPVFDIPSPQQLHRIAEQQYPSLRGKQYRMEPVIV